MIHPVQFVTILVLVIVVAVWLIWVFTENENYSSGPHDEADDSFAEQHRFPSGQSDDRVGE